MSRALTASRRYGLPLLGESNPFVLLRASPQTSALSELAVLSGRAFIESPNLSRADILLDFVPKGSTPGVEIPEQADVSDVGDVAVQNRDN